MFERFPGLNLHSLTVNWTMLPKHPLRRQYPTLLCPRPCSRVRATFLVWCWLRRAARIVALIVSGSVRCPSFHLYPRTLLLLIFRADPRSVQHTRCGLGNAFGADA